MPMPPKNAELARRLQNGETVAELIAEGHPKTTVHRLAQRIERGEYTAPAEPRQGGKASSGTQIRLTQEQLTIPSAMFMLYDHCQMLHPEYPQTKSEWLMDVVRCWAEDHSEELGFDAMSWAYDTQQLEQEDDLDESEATQAGDVLGEDEDWITALIPDGRAGVLEPDSDGDEAEERGEDPGDSGP